MGMNYMNKVWFLWKFCEKACYLQATEPPLQWDMAAVGDPAPQDQQVTFKSTSRNTWNTLRNILLKIFFHQKPTYYTGCYFSFMSSNIVYAF